jgi:hypothetical protein
MVCGSARNLRRYCQEKLIHKSAFKKFAEECRAGFVKQQLYTELLSE